MSQAGTEAKDHRGCLGEMRDRMQRTGQWHPGQLAGRRWPIGCVSLEISQRCNLDCTLCYLSESSESVRDLPMEEIFRRIELILEHYGPGTDVQVSGGEPTLRRRAELVAIVRRLAEVGLRPTLFTNGIQASRSLLEELAEVGLVDVAFHVDTTQQRKGHRSESDLNALREEYIERARDLPIGVFFNTTVHAGNLEDVPMLAAFFAAHSDVVRLASFQLQAETGRGVLGARSDAVHGEGLTARLQQGLGAPLRFDALSAGHRDCNRYAVALVIGDRAYDAYADVSFIRRFMHETAFVAIERETPWRGARSLILAALKRPTLLAASLAWLGRLGWRARRDLVAARGRVHKLTFFIHDFMDACRLDEERIEACVFMAMSQEGPISMCRYNARRDDYLLRPLKTSTGVWQPLRETARSSRERSLP